jgi:cellulose biosynthesis protein BcsQ
VVGWGLLEVVIELLQKHSGLAAGALSAITGVLGFGLKWWLGNKSLKAVQDLVDGAEKAMKRAELDRDEAKSERETANKDLSKEKIELGIAREDLKRLEKETAAKGLGVAAGEERLQKLLDSLSRSTTNLWTTRQPTFPFEDYNNRIARLPAAGSSAPRPVIMTLVNYKGGVGKTTTTGNLAAFFDKKLGKRVLLIDLDYQGSLTTMLRTATGLQERKEGVNDVFSANAGLATLLTVADGLSPTLPKSQLIQSFYEFARKEEHLMIQWLLQQTADDVRYRLAQILLHDDIGRKFDVVLIDAPPRLTTATINALCASTHVLIPTILNPISSEPVINFLKQTQILTNVLNPKLSILGVLETMVPPSNQRQDARQKARIELQEGLKQFKDIHILKASISRKPALADGGLAYLDDPDVAAAFDSLGKELVGKIGALP